MRNLIIVCLIILNSSINVIAQNDLSAEMNEQIQDRIVDILDDFQFWLGELANKKNPQQVRLEAYKSNCELFIGKCEPYTVTDIETGEIERKEPVKMETSSVLANGRISKKRRPMKEYFNGLLNNTRYTNIEIEQSKAIRVDNLRKVSEGRYEAVAHFYQLYTGYGGERVLYKDYTEKDVRVIVSYEEVPRPYDDYDKVEIIITVKLGDMKVALTERIR